jgi:hypothetical protein
MTATEITLAALRLRRDAAAARGDHAEALILNDRIKDLKDGSTSATVESVTQQFERDLAKRRARIPE